MKIATWNVNSIRSRLERLLRWLEKTEPDVVCLQELKGTEDTFPFDPIRDAGYHAVVCGHPQEHLPMNRYGNVSAVTEIGCDLCDGLLRLTLVDDRPREGEITLASKTTV
jgi:hypothetical protein